MVVLPCHSHAIFQDEPVEDETLHESPAITKRRRIIPPTQPEDENEGENTPASAQAELKTQMNERFGEDLKKHCLENVNDHIIDFGNVGSYPQFHIEGLPQFNKLMDYLVHTRVQGVFNLEYLFASL